MQRIRRLALAAALILVAGCGSSSGTGPAQYYVQYIVSVTGNAVVDSVRYDDGTGTMVTVAHPTLGVVKTLTPKGSFTVRAVAWVHYDVSSGAKLKANWWINGGVSYADSSYANVNTPSASTLSIPLHSI